MASHVPIRSNRSSVVTTASLGIAASLGRDNQQIADYSSEDDEVEIANMTERHRRKLEGLLARPVSWSDDDEGEGLYDDDDSDGDVGVSRRASRSLRSGSSFNNSGHPDDDAFEEDIDAIAMSINLLNPSRRRNNTEEGNVNFLAEKQRRESAASAKPSTADTLRKRWYKGRGDSSGGAYKEMDAAVRRDQSFSLRELKKLRAIFESLDDEGGMIFRVFVEKVGPIIRHKAKGATLHDMEVLFKRIDANANGSVDWFEISDFLLMNDVKTSARAMGGAGNPQQFEREAISRQSASDHPATRFLYHAESATRLLINHKYGHYYTSSTDGSAKMWDPDTLRHERTFHYSKSPVIDMVQTTWGDAVGVLAMDGTASFYTPDTGDLIRVYRAEKKREMGIIGGGRGVVDDRRGCIHRPIFTVPLGAQELEEIKHSDATSTFGKIDACAPHLSHFVRDEQIETVGLENLGWIPRSALSREARAMSAGDVRGTSSIIHYDPSGGSDSMSSHASTLVSAGYVSSMATFNDAKADKPTKVLFGLESGHLQLYDVDPPSAFGMPIAVPNRVTLAAHQSCISRISVCESMSFVFTASHDGTLQVRHWDRLEDYGVRLGEGALTTAAGGGSGSPIEDQHPSYVDIAQRGHTRRITGMDWSLRARILASCAPERDALLWSPYLPKPIMKLEGEPMSHMVDIRFCDAVGQVMTLSSNRTVKLWDIRTYRCIHTLRDGSLRQPQREALQVAAFDKRKSAVVLGTTFPRQWLVVQNNKYSNKYVGHRLPIVGMALSAEFGQLVTADEKYIIVWDAVYQTVIVKWRVTEGVTGITLDTNGRRLLVSTLQGNVLVYNYVNAQLLKQCYPSQPQPAGPAAVGAGGGGGDGAPAPGDGPLANGGQRTTCYERPWLPSARNAASRALAAKKAAMADKSAEAEAAAALAPESKHEVKAHEWEVDLDEQLILHEARGDGAPEGGASPHDNVIKVNGGGRARQETRFVCFGELTYPHKQFLVVSGFEDGTAVVYVDSDTAVSYPLRSVDVRSYAGGASCAAVVAPSLLVLGGDGTLVCQSVDEANAKTFVMPLLSQQHSHGARERQGKGGPDGEGVHLMSSIGAAAPSPPLPSKGAASGGAAVVAASSHSSVGVRSDKPDSIGGPSPAPFSATASPLSPASPPFCEAVPCMVALFEGPLSHDPLLANQTALERRDAAIIDAMGAGGRGDGLGGHGDVVTNKALHSQLPCIEVIAVMGAVAPYVLVTGSSDGIVQLWSGRSLQEVFRFRATLVAGDAITALLLSVDGRHMAVGDSSGYITTFDLSPFVEANAVTDGHSMLTLVKEDAGFGTSRGAGYDEGAVKNTLAAVSLETMEAFAYVGQARQAKSSAALAMIDAKSRGRDRGDAHEGQGRWASLPDVTVDPSMFTMTKRFRAHEGAVRSLVRLDTNSQSGDRNVLRRDNPEAFVQERDGDYISSEADGGRLRYLYSAGADSFVYLWDVIDVQGISCVGDSAVKVNPLPHADRAVMMMEACRRQCISQYVLAYEQAVTSRLRAQVVADIAEERRAREEAKQILLLGTAAGGGTPQSPAGGAGLGSGLNRQARRLGTRRQEDAERRKQDEADRARYNAVRHEGAALDVLVAFVTDCIHALDAPSAEDDFTPLDNTPSLPRGSVVFPTSSPSSGEYALPRDHTAYRSEDVSDALRRATADAFASPIDGDGTIAALVERTVSEMCQSRSADAFLTSTGLHALAKANALGAEGSPVTALASAMAPELLRAHTQGHHSSSPLFPPASRGAQHRGSVLLGGSMGRRSVSVGGLSEAPHFGSVRYLLNPFFAKEAAALIGAQQAKRMLVGTTDWKAHGARLPFNVALAGAMKHNSSPQRGGVGGGLASMSMLGGSSSLNISARGEGGESSASVFGANTQPQTPLGAPLVTSALFPEGDASGVVGSPPPSRLVSTPPPTLGVNGPSPSSVQPPPALAGPAAVEVAPWELLSPATNALHHAVAPSANVGGLSPSISGNFISATPDAAMGDGRQETPSTSLGLGGAMGGIEGGPVIERFVVRPPRFLATGTGRMRDGIAKSDDALERENIRNMRDENNAAFDVSASEPSRTPNGSPEKRTDDGRMKLRMTNAGRGEGYESPAGEKPLAGYSPRRLTATERTELLSGGQTSSGVALEALSRGTAVVANLILKYGTPAMKARYLPLLVGTRHEGPRRLGALCVLDAGSSDPLQPQSTTLQEAAAGGGGEDALDASSASLASSAGGGGFHHAGTQFSPTAGKGAGRKGGGTSWLLKGSKVCLSEHVFDDEGGDPSPQRRGRLNVASGVKGGGGGGPRASDADSAAIGTLFVVLAKGPLQYHSRDVARYPSGATAASASGPAEGDGRDPSFPLTLLVIDSVDHPKRLKYAGRPFAAHDLTLTNVVFVDVPINRPSLQVLGQFEDGRQITVEVLNHIRMGIPHQAPSVNAVMQELVRTAEEVAKKRRERQDRATALESEAIKANRDDTGAELPLMARLLASDLGILQKTKEKAVPNTSIVSSCDGSDAEATGGHSPSKHSGLREADIQLLRNMGIAPSFVNADEAEVIGGDAEALLTPREKEQRHNLVRDVLRFTTATTNCEANEARAVPSSGSSTPRRGTASLNGSRARVPILQAAAGRPAAPSSARSGRPVTGAVGNGGVAQASTPRGMASSSLSNAKVDVHAMQASLRDMRQISVRLRNEHVARRAKALEEANAMREQRAKEERDKQLLLEVGQETSARGGPRQLDFLAFLGDEDAPHVMFAPPPRLIGTDVDAPSVADPTIFGEDGEPAAAQPVPKKVVTTSIPTPTISPRTPRRSPAVPSLGASAGLNAGAQTMRASFTDLINKEATLIRGRVLEGRKERLMQTMDDPFRASYSGAPSPLVSSTSTHYANPLHAASPYDDVVASIDEVSGKGSLWDTSHKALEAIQGARGVSYRHGDEYMAERLREAVAVAGGGPDGVMGRDEGGVPSLFIEGLLGGVSPSASSMLLDTSVRRRSSILRPDASVSVRGMAMAEVRHLATQQPTQVVSVPATTTASSPRHASSPSSPPPPARPATTEDEDEEMLRHADDYFEKVIGVRILQRQMEIGDYVTDKEKRALIGLPHYTLTERERERYRKGFLTSDVCDRREFLPTSPAANHKKAMTWATNSDVLLQRLQERRRVNDGDPPLIESALMPGVEGQENVPAPSGDDDPQWLARVYTQLPVGPPLAMPPRPVVSEEDGGHVYQQFTAKEVTQARENAWLRLLTNTRHSTAAGGLFSRDQRRTTRPNTRSQITQRVPMATAGSSSASTGARIPQPPPSRF